MAYKIFMIWLLRTSLVISPSSDHSELLEFLRFRHAFYTSKYFPMLFPVPEIISFHPENPWQIPFGLPIFFGLGIPSSLQP